MHTYRRKIFQSLQIPQSEDPDADLPLYASVQEEYAHAPQNELTS